MPCTTRAAMREWMSGASPAPADAAVNSARANRKVRFVPNRSPIQPDAGMNTATLSR